MRLVKAAHRAGADAVKFQMFTPREELFCPMEGDENRWARWNESMLKFSEWKRVKEFADELGIHFLASVFQKTGIEWLKELNPVAWKVASRAAEMFPCDDVYPGPFIISLGCFEEKYVGGFYPQTRGGRCEWIGLDCRLKYPCPLKFAKWRGGEEWGENNYSYKGLSDHSGTVFPALDAMARGAEVIEVHFALRKEDAGPDREVSLTPAELKQITEARDGFAAMR